MTDQAKGLRWLHVVSHGREEAVLVEVRSSGGGGGGGDAVGAAGGCEDFARCT